MRKLIILLLCCGVLISIVGCGVATAPPPTESLPTTLSETVITETLAETITATTVVEPTEKETVTTESKDQATVLITIAPTSTVQPTEETKPTETPKMSITNTAEEKGASRAEEKVTSATPPKEEQKIESIKGTAPEPETIPPEFDIHCWISFAKEYAVSVGLTLESEAESCWDNPIGANSRCIYLERDIVSRLNRYANDEDITDVWIWAEPIGNDCYDIYIGYA